MEKRELRAGMTITYDYAYPDMQYYEVTMKNGTIIASGRGYVKDLDGSVAISDGVKNITYFYTVV